MKRNKIIVVLFVFITHLIVDNYVFYIGAKKIFTIHFFLFFLWLMSDVIQEKIIRKKHILSLLFLMNFIRGFFCLAFLFLPTLVYGKGLNTNYIIHFFLVYFFHNFFSIISRRGGNIKIKA